MFRAALEVRVAFVEYIPFLVHVTAACLRRTFAERTLAACVSSVVHARLV